MTTTDDDDRLKLLQLLKAIVIREAQERQPWSADDDHFDELCVISPNDHGHAYDHEYSNDSDGCGDCCCSGCENDHYDVDEKMKMMKMTNKTRKKTLSQTKMMNQNLTLNQTTTIQMKMMTLRTIPTKMTKTRRMRACCSSKLMFFC